jgi:hypothetical protein
MEKDSPELKERSTLTEWLLFGCQSFIKPFSVNILETCSSKNSLVQGRRYTE